jgi:hypothetical protein
MKVRGDLDRAVFLARAAVAHALEVAAEVQAGEHRTSTRLAQATGALQGALVSIGHALGFLGSSQSGTYQATEPPVAPPARVPRPDPRREPED